MFLFFFSLLPCRNFKRTDKVVVDFGSEFTMCVELNDRVSVAISTRVFEEEENQLDAIKVH